MLCPYLWTDTENYLAWDQSPTDDTWLIHIPDLYASIWDNSVGSSCPADRENHLMWAHVTKTSALSLGQWPLRHTPFTLPSYSKGVRIVAKGIRIMSKIQMRLVQHSLHKTWEVWEKKKKNRSDILSTRELVSQMRMTKSKHLDLTIWKS